MRSSSLRNLAPAGLALLSLAPQTALSTDPSSSSSSSSSGTIASSEAAARRNAFQIFNAAGSALRQWGSSVQHNGLSFFLATAPQGSVFYHGTNTPDRPASFEWLAFEIEHAQNFARSRNFSDGRPPSPPPGGGGGGGGGPPPRPPPEDTTQRQHPMALHDGLGGHNYGDKYRGEEGEEDEEEDLALLFHPARMRLRTPPPGTDPNAGEEIRGYLHTYRATRPLNLLYLDGMSAGNSDFGTLDAQDFILLDWDDYYSSYDAIPTRIPKRGDHGVWDEFSRAEDLCALADEWSWDGGKIDGFVRMEAGFEIVYCDFRDGGGLELVEATASPLHNETGWAAQGVLGFEWYRAASLRYNGFPAGRIDVDWSSMVSAFFYDVNLTNPDPARAELPRLLNTTRAERRAIHARVAEVVARRHHRAASDASPERGGPPRASSVNWQGIVDLVVTRYADRLELLAGGDLDAATARGVVAMLLLPYTDYASGGGKPRASLEMCRARYLETALAAREAGDGWTQEDGLLLAAVETVTGRICGALIELWDAIEDKGEGDGEEEEEEEVRSKVKEVVRPLVAQLDWPAWRDCGRCASRGEICFVAMFPFGSWADHYAPRCRDAASMRERNDSYWRHPRWG